MREGGGGASSSRTSFNYQILTLLDVHTEEGRKREGMEMRDVGGRLLLRDSQRSLSHTAESVIGGVCVCACVSQGDSRCNGNRKRDEKGVTGGAYLARDRRDDGP